MIAVLNLLAECEDCGIVLKARGGRLEIDAPADALTPELLARLRGDKSKLLTVLAERHDRETTVIEFSGKEVNIDWPAASADFVLLLCPEDLPATPFEFGGPHSVVCDRRKFLESLQADIRRGPKGPRAHYGAIQADIGRLRDLLIGGKSR